MARGIATTSWGAHLFFTLKRLVIILSVTVTTASDSCNPSVQLCRVKESATVSEITDSYRQLARKWHPDKNKNRREEAEAQFAVISHAYGILKNDDSRRDYNYALRHPEEFAYNHARYYYTQYYTRHFKVRVIDERPARGNWCCNKHFACSFVKDL